MPSLLLDLLPYLCRVLLLTPFIASLFASLWFGNPDPPATSILSILYTMVGMLAALFLLGVRRDQWLWRFVARTRHFLTASSGRVVLRYASELQGVADPQDVLVQADQALTDLEARFGHGQPAGPLLFRRRVHVYLFPTCEAVQMVFGQRYAGIALTGLHAVVLPFDGRPLGEWLRHELGHLFSDRWNPLAPPLLQEGLSTWLQGTEQGCTIDTIAIGLLRQGDYHLRPLLDRKFFFGEVNSWLFYVLAGSFTGFLIARFGWDAYKRFYRHQAGRRRFDTRFKKHFSMTLEEAEGMWRDELLKRFEASGEDWLADEGGQV